jgi:hypothetical protein
VEDAKETGYMKNAEETGFATGVDSWYNRNEKTLFTRCVSDEKCRKGCGKAE